MKRGGSSWAWLTPGCWSVVDTVLEVKSSSSQLHKSRSSNPPLPTPPHPPPTLQPHYPRTPPSHPATTQLILLQEPHRQMRAMCHHVDIKLKRQGHQSKPCADRGSFRGGGCLFFLGVEASDCRRAQWTLEINGIENLPRLWVKEVSFLSLS